MKLIVTADLHYGLRPQGDASTRVLADVVAASGADALVLAGDNAAIEASLFRQCFRSFDGFPGRKFAICGNHDLWTVNGNSFRIYEEEFPGYAAEAGFEYLEGHPVVLGRVGIVGTVGWYDYSFRDPSLQLDNRYYEAKFHPRLARWNDGEYVKLGMSDPEFARLALERLETGIRSIYDSVEVIVAITHTVAFDAMLIRKPQPAWNFCNAFMGSVALGDLLLRYPKVRTHFCGHTHERGRHRIGNLETINVGSTYLEKRFEVLEL